MRRGVWGWLVVLGVGVASLAANACDFYFNYDSIAAPIGTVGEIGIRIQKTHNNCTLTSMDEYIIEGAGIQILGETPWEDVGRDLYEKWLQVSLSLTGEGFLKISKTCTKEGYQEQVLPIAVRPSESEDSVWAKAWNGDYPFETSWATHSIMGAPTLEENTLSISSVSVVIPSGTALPEELPETLRLFTTQRDGATIALLLVGDGLFLRFDQHLR